MSEFLRILENEVQIIALTFMGTVYVLRLLWMFRRFKAANEITHGVGNKNVGIAYSMMNVAMPWAMESVRKNWSFYAQFVIFHVGVVLAISATFIIPYWPELFEAEWIVRLFQLLLGAAFAVGIIRLIRRITNPVLRLVSSPDDYFSLVLLTAFFASGIFAVPNEYEVSEWPLIVFFIMTTFFLIYVPFSKISHYLYYPFTRYFLGKTMGHRGVFPRKKGGEKPAGLLQAR
jgi:nitrate reductase gamma subunit